MLVSATYPFQWLTLGLGKIILDLPSNIVNLGNLSKENARLKEEFEAAQAKLNLFEELEGENQRLREALGFTKVNPYDFKLLAARVVARGASTWNSLVEIDRGSSNGAYLGMAVMDKKGLVGKVVEVNPFVSKVLLIVDPSSAVASCDQRSKDCGLVQGGQGNKLKMNYVETGADIRVGDKVITAPISEVFPPGIPVGTIVKAIKNDSDFFYQIEIEPAVIFSRLEEVYLIK